MQYYTIPGFEAKVFVPETNHSEGRKYNCTDCFSCQLCSDERCDACIKKTSCKKDKNLCDNGS